MDFVLQHIGQSCVIRLVEPPEVLSNLGFASWAALDTRGYHYGWKKKHVGIQEMD